MSAPSLLSITETPLAGGINPFERFLPGEMVERVLDNIDTQEGRLAAEYACKRFLSFAPRLLEEGETWIVFHATPVSKDEEFYKSLKKRMGQLNVKFLSDDFHSGMGRFHDFLIKQLPDRVLPFLPEQMISIHKLRDRFLDDAIESYAGQDIEKMTPENFMERAEFLSSYFPEFMLADSVENLMRKAIKKRETAAIESVRAEFANPSPDAPRFHQMQRSVTALLEQEREGLEKRRLELCGPHGFDGAIDAAYRTQLQARANLAATVRHIGGLIAKRCGEFASGIDIGQYTLNTYSFFLNFGDVNTTEVSRANMEYTDAKAKHVTLVEELKLFAEFDETGQIVGGMLHSNERALQPDAIARRARFEMTRRADFLEELNRDVVEDAGDTRAQTLLAIFNRQFQ